MAYFLENSPQIQQEFIGIWVYFLKTGYPKLNFSKFLYRIVMVFHVSIAFLDDMFAHRRDSFIVKVPTEEIFSLYRLTLLRIKVWQTNCFPPAFEFWTTAEVVNEVVKGAKIQISLNVYAQKCSSKQICNLAPFSTSLPTSAEECQKFKISPPHAATLWNQVH